MALIVSGYVLCQQEIVFFYFAEFYVFPRNEFCIHVAPYKPSWYLIKSKLPVHLYRIVQFFINLKIFSTVQMQTIL